MYMCIWIWIWICICICYVYFWVTTPHHDTVRVEYIPNKYPTRFILAQSGPTEPDKPLKPTNRHHINNKNNQTTKLKLQSEVVKKKRSTKKKSNGKRVDRVDFVQSLRKWFCLSEVYLLIYSTTSLLYYYRTIELQQVQH